MRRSLHMLLRNNIKIQYAVVERIIYMPCVASPLFYLSHLCTLLCPSCCLSASILACTWASLASCSSRSLWRSARSALSFSSSAEVLARLLPRPAACLVESRSSNLTRVSSRLRSLRSSWRRGRRGGEHLGSFDYHSIYIQNTGVGSF